VVCLEVKSLSINTIPLTIAIHIKRSHLTIGITCIGLSHPWNTILINWLKQIIIIQRLIKYGQTFKYPDGYDIECNR